MTPETEFKLTYSTMFSPPEELHTRFEEALQKVKGKLGQEHGMIIDGKERFASEKFENRSPINTEWVLGIFQKGTATGCERCDRSRQTGFPDVEPHALAGARRADSQSRGYHRPAHL